MNVLVGWLIIIGIGSSSSCRQVLSNDIDLLHPPVELERRKHKLKRLVQSPNSFFMDVKCQGCFTITTVFSHSQTVVVCGSCSTVLCQPTGGKARLTEGCSFRKKGDQSLWSYMLDMVLSQSRFFLVQRRAIVVTSSAFRDHLLKLLQILYGWAFVTTFD